MLVFHTTKSNESGFTLIEIMMVLVIAGLIAAAASYGNTLIQQSSMRALINNIANYSVAAKNFQQTYEALPGDYVLATTNLGCSSCNGDGDRLIEWQATNNTVEALRAWQHLNLAGLITTPFPGTASTAGQSDIGTNIPNAGWPNAGIEFYPLATTYSGSTGAALQIAAFTTNSYANAPIMTPREAWELDKKIDDGIGGSGIIRGFAQGTSSTCVGTDNLTYNFSLTTVVCTIRYLLFP